MTVEIEKDLREYAICDQCGVRSKPLADKHCPIEDATELAGSSVYGWCIESVEVCDGVDLCPKCNAKRGDK